MKVCEEKKDSISSFFLLFKAMFIHLTTRRGLKMSISMYTSSNSNKKVMNYHKRFMRCVITHSKSREKKIEAKRKEKREERKIIICYRQVYSMFDGDAMVEVSSVVVRVH